jgi:hypothetical protein
MEKMDAVHGSLLFELISAAFGIAILGIFGIMVMMPIEVMILASEQSSFYIYILVAGAMLISFWYLTIFPENARWLLRLMDGLGMILTGFILLTYLSFTTDFSASWMVEGVWFLREKGWIVGLWLFIMVIKTSAAVTVLTATAQEISNNRPFYPYIIGACILTGICILSGVLLLIYRHLNPFWFYTSIFGMQSVLGISGIFSLIMNRTSSALDFHPNVYTEFPSYTGRRKERPGNMKIKERLARFFQSKGLILDVRLWKMFKRTRVILLFLGIAAILHAFKFTFKAFHPIEYAAVLFFITFIGLFVFLTSLAVADKENTQTGLYFSNRISPVWLRLCGILELFGLMIVVCFSLYYYTNPMYIPDVLAKKAFFGIFGIILYYGLIGGLGHKISHRNREILRVIFYYGALILLVLNIRWIIVDGLSYGVGFNGNITENVFVFQYLHSLQNNAFVGIALGIIGSDWFFRFALRGDKGHRTQSRAVLFVIIPFIVGLMMTIFNYILVATPNGLYPYESPMMFQNLGLVLQYILGIIMILYFIPNVLFPLLRNRNTKGEPLGTTRKIGGSIIQSIHYPKILKTTGLICMVGFSLIAGVAIPVVYAISYQRPIVVNSPGNYFVWIEGSSNLVLPDTRVSVQSSSKVPFAELNLAKNEYGALQIVWHPIDDSLQRCSFEITNFTHQNQPESIITSTCFDLRYVRSVIDNKYPDVLMPIEQLLIQENQNTALWFSVRTPYDIAAGKYQGSVIFNFTLKNQIIIEEVPIQLNIWNFTIPLTHHLRTRYGCGDWNDAKQLDSYFSHRVNSDGPPLSTTTDWTTFTTGENITAFMNITTREWIFNWTYYDEQIELLLARKGNLFMVGFGAGFDRNPDLSDPLLKDQIQNYLRGVQAHLDEKGWSQYAYMYFIDEFEMFIPKGMTRAEYFAKLAIIMEWIDEVTPRIKLTAVSPPEEDLVYYLNDYIDIYCPTTYDRDKPMWDARIAEGKEMWYYVCVGPILPYPNNHYYNRLYEGRILNWQMWLYGLRGNLGWSIYHNRHGAYSVGYNGYGDGVFLYYENNQIYESIRWELVLEGIEDYEYFWVFNQTLNVLEQTGAFNVAEIAAYRNELQQRINTVIGEKWYYTDHVNDIYSGREWVGNQLNSLSNYVNVTEIAEWAINWTDFSLTK